MFENLPQEIKDAALGLLGLILPRLLLLSVRAHRESVAGSGH